MEQVPTFLLRTARGFLPCFTDLLLLVETLCFLPVMFVNLLKYLLGLL